MPCLPLPSRPPSGRVSHSSFFWSYSLLQQTFTYTHIDACIYIHAFKILRRVLLVNVINRLSLGSSANGWLIHYIYSYNNIMIICVLYISGLRGPCKAPRLQDRSRTFVARRAMVSLFPMMAAPCSLSIFQSKSDLIQPTLYTQDNLMIFHET